MRQVALITGGAKRVGAEIVRYLHNSGFDIVLHFNNSLSNAVALKDELEIKREKSVILIKYNLDDFQHCERVIEIVNENYGRLDILINNASIFLEDKNGKYTEEDWDSLVNVNMKTPFFLSQCAFDLLKKYSGCIVNMTDINAIRPMKKYSAYNISKAGLDAITKSLAKDFAPDVRVNAIAPGLILWNELDIMSDKTKNRILSKIPLKTIGMPIDIARTVLFLYQSKYITGQTICVDGGRTLNQ